MALSTLSMPLKCSPNEVLMANCSEASLHRTDGMETEIHRLTSAVARGDETAFLELYDRFHARLFRLLVVLNRGDESLAHEIVQSVMLTAARKLRPVESEEHLWNWLARVARQHLSKVWRRQQRDSNLLNFAESPSQVELTEPDTVLDESLDAAMNALEAEDRRVVQWYYYEALSQKEIADRLGSSAKAVSSRLERARNKLRSFIEKRLRHET